jgi:hypothetical protein
VASEALTRKLTSFAPDTLGVGPARESDQGTLTDRHPSAVFHPNATLMAYTHT